MSNDFAKLVLGTFLMGAGAASAADLPTRKSPPEPAPLLAQPYSWTGCSIGLQGGWGHSQTTWQDVDVPGDIDGTGANGTATTSADGAVYGGQAGCDYQFASSFVAGVGGLFLGSTVDNTQIDSLNSPTWVLKNRITWLGSLTGRVGYTFDNVLLYGRGGAAWAGNHYNIVDTGFDDGSANSTRFGWTLGGGAAYAFAAHWSVFSEFNYYSFNKQTIGFPGNVGIGDVPFHVKSGQTAETVTLGVNYKF